MRATILIERTIRTVKDGTACAHSCPCLDWTSLMCSAGDRSVVLELGGNAIKRSTFCLEGEIAARGGAL